MQIARDSSEPTKRPRGVTAILYYKLVKATLMLSSAVCLVVLIVMGLAPRVRDFAITWSDQLTGAWAKRLVALLGHVTPRRLELTSLLLGLDGALSAVEGWALHVGHWWGPWLVVVASGSLLPFELYEVFRVPRLSRFAILGMNLVIVAYLGRRELVRHRARKLQSP